MVTATTLGLWICSAAIPLYLLRLNRKSLRPSRVSPTTERVLIVGASSGIGRALAKQYATRGASLIVVGRREHLINEVAEECRAAGAGMAVGIAADFTNVDDMVRVRELVMTAMKGLDTLVVAAGVSALQPLVTGVAGAQRHGSKFKDNEPSLDGIKRAKEVATLAVNGNYLGPLVSAVTFIPLLENTSQSPAILLISSVAAVIPAPTRSLYVSTKGASLLLFQSLSIEHPKIAFSHVLPGTVEGDFRASAVDGGDVREVLTGALDRGDVASACIKAVDSSAKHVFLPFKFHLGLIVYWLFPKFIEEVARKKYNFEA